MTDTDDKSGLDLPAPASPRELDQRILGYARERASQRAWHWQSGWTAGLATASVVAVAVLISMPQEPPTSSSPALEPRLESPARSAQPVAESAAAERGSAAAESPPAPQSSAKMALQRRAPAAAAGASLPADGADLASAATSLDTMEEESPAAEPHGDVAMKESIAGPAARLEEIAAQFRDGDEQAAREAYHLLRRECPSCDLPETLEQALAGISAGPPGKPRP